ncbi:hypothetical protein L3X38_041107 [Prunus dulcis]|uniref:Uncharacterized protein n=1 Tax=Prunus dulcis TaxID=3755 RepID=A0AAD4YKC0_PRUDU|nr:hypothetical protein L3X38_041107 [Prunus dulcis]
MVRVKKIIFTSLHHEAQQGGNKTAEQLFNSEHAKLLQSAQTWIKGRLLSHVRLWRLWVATVVYAAAYTAPGGK